ncbi:TPA: hypothetical protein ACVGJ1_002840 [Pseudomonas aeruginosa]|uniref:hypothetical protein n=1 Tax=Pseudomonas aeruginosa TaxID=287 RepID=UPI0015F0ADBC|nr:hypothetical protein [Pseudomonas aeruginosa]
MSVTEPVRLPDGSLENFMVKVGGKPFRCSCGCNVFHKPNRDEPEHYKCNSCGTEYASD